MRTLPLKPSPFHGRATPLAPSRRPIKREPVARPVFVFGLLLLLGTAAWADIECKEVYDPNEQIVVNVTATNVPEGAKLRGSFQVTGAMWDLVSVPNAARLRQAASGLQGMLTSVTPEQQVVITTAIDEITKATTGETFHVWAGEGKHTITASGVWVMTKSITIGAETFDVLIDFGQYSYTRDFVVGDGPDPPPPPPPPGTRWAVIWEETDGGRTPEQGNLYLNLRKEFQDSRLRILDVTNLPPSLRALESQRPQNLPLPVLQVIARQADGTDKVVRTVPLPSSVDAVKAEIAK